MKRRAEVDARAGYVIVSSVLARGIQSVAGWVERAEQPVEDAVLGEMVRSALDVSRSGVPDDDPEWLGGSATYRRRLELAGVRNSGQYERGLRTVHVSQDGPEQGVRIRPLRNMGKGQHDDIPGAAATLPPGADDVALGAAVNAALEVAVEWPDGPPAARPRAGEAGAGVPGGGPGRDAAGQGTAAAGLPAGAEEVLADLAAALGSLPGARAVDPEKMLRRSARWQVMARWVRPLRRLRRFSPWHKRWAELAKVLGRLGMWDGLDPEAAAAQAAEVAAGGYPLTLPVFDGLSFDADGEDLAEGDVDVLLQEMAPALHRFGVDLQVRIVELPGVDEDPFLVEINGRICAVWEPADWDSGRAWYVATVRPLAVVNELLAEAGARVRVHVLAPGENDGTAFLVDPRVVEAMRSSGLFQPKDLPQLATQPPG